MDRETEDALFEGRLRLTQPARAVGYRVNVDALLLASFAARPSPARVAFDLGAGVGAVGLTLLYFGAARRVVFVEIDEELAALAERNLVANGWQGAGEVLVGEVSNAIRSRRGEAQLVVCNPPYVLPGHGRSPANAAKARARSGELTMFVRAARLVAGRRARVCFVYPAPEALTLLSTLREAGLEPKRLRAVHATADSPARVVLVEALPAKAGGLTILPPLIERVDDGFSPEMRALLARVPNDRGVS